MLAPRISLVAYADREPRFIFVAVPNERGRYMRTDASVALVPCSHCGAAIGEPCKREFSASIHHHAQTHCARRAADDRRRTRREAKPRYRIVDGVPELIAEGV